MMDMILEILVGQLPEAIYFALFLLFTKEIKEKRLLFLGITIFEYIALFNAFPMSLWSRVLFFIVTYTALKILYKEKAQITDIFTMTIASILVILIGVILYPIVLLFSNQYLVYAILNRICLLLALILIRHKLPIINKIYKKLWNRNDTVKKKMKSTTFRALNTVVFNVMFAVINFGIIISLILFGR